MTESCFDRVALSFRGGGGGGGAAAAAAGAAGGGAGAGGAGGAMMSVSHLHCMGISHSRFRADMGRETLP